MSVSLPNDLPEVERRDQQHELRLIAQAASQTLHPHVGGLVLGEGLFKDAVVRERKRADRFGTPLTVLLVERAASSSAGDCWASTLRIVVGMKRDVDVLGWLEPGDVLALLLPDTTVKAALRIMHRLQRAIARRLGAESRAAPSMRLYAHGPGTDAGHILSVDLLLEAFVPRRNDAWSDAVKRGLDIVGSLALLALFAPIFMAVFVAVKWSSPGPALFHQVRLGHRGRPFTMLKFRTMFVNAGHAVHENYVTWFIKSSGQQPHNGDQIFKLISDTRITPIGRFLRRTSLDELPQFWNVLRGEMSLVGPRPSLPFEVEQYQPWHRRRLFEGKPGITGPWQVNGRSRTTFDEMVRLDLRYARTRSLWTDVRILLATPRAMLSGKGAC